MQNSKRERKENRREDSRRNCVKGRRKEEEIKGRKEGREERKLKTEKDEEKVVGRGGSFTRRTRLRVELIDRASVMQISRFLGDASATMRRWNRASLLRKSM